MKYINFCTAIWDREIISGFVPFKKLTPREGVYKSNGSARHGFLDPE